MLYVFLNFVLFVLSDAKMDYVGKAIEEEFTGESDDIFCAACNFHCKGGTLVEDDDLTTHLMSETQEIDSPVIYL